MSKSYPCRAMASLEARTGEAIVLIRDFTLPFIPTRRTELSWFAEDGEEVFWSDVQGVSWELPAGRFFIELATRGDFEEPHMTAKEIQEEADRLVNMAGFVVFAVREESPLHKKYPGGNWN